MRVWITWETHRRSRELAAAFGCRYHELEYSDHGAWIRYRRSALETLKILRLEKPSAVFVQCPSLVLASLVALVRRFRRFVFVIDAHNVIPNYARSKNWFLRHLTAFCLSSADYVVVTNNSLQEPVCSLGGRPLILPDKLPRILPQSLARRLAQCRRPYVTLICSFHSDEPVSRVLEAVRSLDNQMTLFVTGRRPQTPKLACFESERIVFTDFLPQYEFDGLIQHSDLIIDLTTDPYVLVCGAYEAIAVGVPVLLADFPVTRSTFSSGCLFAADSVAAYRQALLEFLNNPAEYRTAVSAFAEEFERRWQEQFAIVEKTLDAESSAR